jgi:hypothetical protein
MAIEARRGCGYRKVGGLYLCSDGGGVACDRLPIPCEVCPTCGHGIKQARGWTWIDVAAFVGGVHRDCSDQFACPLCMATSEMGKAGLIWIGERFYKTPFAFASEAAELGVSRRIKVIPRNFVVGETWILLAHPRVIHVPGCANCDHEPTVHNSNTGELIPACGVVGCMCKGWASRYLPAIFKVWRPSRVERLFWESQRDSDEVMESMKKGIIPIFVPDGDKDHAGSVYDKPDDDDVNGEDGSLADA